MKLKHLLSSVLLAAILLPSCSDSNNSEPNDEPKEYKLVGIAHMITDTNNNGDELPTGFMSPSWQYKDGKLASYTPQARLNVSTMNVTVNTAEQFEASGNFQKQKQMQTVELQNNLVKKQHVSYTDDKRPLEVSDYDYKYSEDGYLESIIVTNLIGIPTVKSEITLTRENGNVTQLVERIVINNKDMLTTYRYTYDDKPYKALSDLAIYTPLNMCTPDPSMHFYDKIGKSNKNNIIEVNIEHPFESTLDYTQITYSTVLNSDGSIKQIDHTGVYYTKFLEEGRKKHTFKGVRTLFEYEPVTK